jgi:predicted methyltransferase
MKINQNVPAVLVLLAAALLAACSGEHAAEVHAADDAAEAETTRAATLIAAAADGEHRSDAHRDRNRYRNPVETLTFFGLTPDQTVIEVWPGAGWYTEVLAPVLRGRGHLIVANFPDDAEAPFQARAARAFRDKLEADPEVYDKVQVVPFAPPAHRRFGEPESADLVLLFRHFHNFIANGIVDDVLDAAHDVLRPGGVLGIVQHRDRADAVPEEELRTGYVREDQLIERVTAAGFVLDAASEVNANPRDTRDHPGGVWALPPTLAQCRSMEDVDERAACEAQYGAIGESDRMTLRFVKPAT